MPNKIDWSSLTHEKRIKILGETTVDTIVATYKIADSDDATFRQFIGRELKLWNPQNIASFKTAGEAPTKDVVLGAWRDLERSEALLELTDNSIDTWLRRKAVYPAKTASELNIYIDIDRATHQLTYEDNAGGVPEEKLENLVVPGHSDTQALSHTIGSYKTGGKKAIFRLAVAAQISTRYWSPSGSNDESISIHLDQAWINDSALYKFPYAQLKNKSVLEKGQTKFILQLREEPIGGPPWFTEPEKVENIKKEILQAYSLLLVRNPSIHIYFLDRTKSLEPVDMYSFSGSFAKGIDLRPQQVIFEFEMDYEGKKNPLSVEIVLGCRTTSGVKGGAPVGIDLYGNDRLFLGFDQSLFSPLLPQGNARNLVRGFVNIKGPNVFIPWDTHKRHLNIDRDIINILTKHPLIVELFSNWKRAYSDISLSEVSKIIKEPLPKPFDKTRSDLTIPHRTKVPLDPNKRRAVSLPKDIYVPKVKTSKRKNNNVAVRMQFTSNEARLIMGYYHIKGDLSSASGEIGASIKETVLKIVAKSK